MTDCGSVHGSVRGRVHGRVHLHFCGHDRGSVRGHAGVGPSPYWREDDRGASTGDCHGDTCAGNSQYIDVDPNCRCDQHDVCVDFIVLVDHPEHPFIHQDTCQYPDHHH